MSRAHPVGNRKILREQAVTAEGPESGKPQPPTDSPTAMQPPEASSHVFISYASQDITVAAALVDALELQSVPAQDESAGLAASVISPRLAQVAQMRYFGAYSGQEMAETLVSRNIRRNATGNRHG